MSSTPAFTPPPLSSAAPDPTSTTTADAAATTSAATSPTAGSSSLYLYTFLATLLLLLGISALIIVRGIVIRRRRARMAVLDGTWAPDPTRGLGLGLGIGEKPRMHEVWLRAGVEETWADMEPVAGRVERVVKPKPKDKSKPVPTPLIPHAFRFVPLSFVRGSRIPPSPRAPPSAKDTHATAYDNIDAKDALARGEDACVALLVAMPCPQPVGEKKGEEEALPVLEIGVVRVRVS